MSSPKKTTNTLHEKAGVSRPETISHKAIQNIKKLKQQQLSTDELITGIRSQNISSLSRAITLVESTNPMHLSKANEIIQGCLPHANKSIRIGITGVPGVGKSTFIEALGKYLTGLGKRVAVLAVDPSSTISHGSILGDKTRMEQLANDKNAFIRPSASGENLGGVAKKTRETIILCEACGFEIILIETVGVGQSETAVHSMVDFFLLLQIAGTGDELQVIKRGIIEMADAIIINKADGDDVSKAKTAQKMFNKILQLFPSKKSGWTPITTTCSAINQDGIDSIWQIILDYLEMVKSNQYFLEKRKEQNQFWMMETINEQLKSHFYNQTDIAELLISIQDAVIHNEISPFAAAQNLLNNYFKK